ncbi:protein DOWN-REGULATED IN DIF1 11-like [Tripterygium wilfordii]|uniref:protein DOWN-REGULATED IN DIF1 11-like n=1 Tax=Tripterygium wilfordii TaxID=458696 RepID=UPI0018F81086|nr:protein DOWN-REGULATED IN DIF1 11-like [Tripterygium wilfordii]
MTMAYVPYPPEPPIYRSEIPPEPRPGYYKYLNYCLSKFSVECKKELLCYAALDVLVTDACCHNLVRMGKKCYIDYVDYVFTIPKFTKGARKGHARANRLWNTCYLRLNH